MTGSISGVHANLPTAPGSAQRSQLEAQLGQAIQRARKHYMQADASDQERPRASPPHLGKNIDIRV